MSSISFSSDWHIKNAENVNAWQDYNIYTLYEYKRLRTIEEIFHYMGLEIYGNNYMTFDPVNLLLTVSGGTQRLSGFYKMAYIKFQGDGQLWSHTNTADPEDLLELAPGTYHFFQCNILYNPVYLYQDGWNAYFGALNKGPVGTTTTYPSAGTTINRNNESTPQEGTIPLSSEWKVYSMPNYLIKSKDMTSVGYTRNPTYSYTNYYTYIGRVFGVDNSGTKKPPERFCYCKKIPEVIFIKGHRVGTHYCYNYTLSGNTLYVNWYTNGGSYWKTYTYTLDNSTTLVKYTRDPANSTVYSADYDLAEASQSTLEQNRVYSEINKSRIYLYWLGCSTDNATTILNLDYHMHMTAEEYILNSGTWSTVSSNSEYLSLIKRNEEYTTDIPFTATGVAKSTGGGGTWACSNRLGNANRSNNTGYNTNFLFRLYATIDTLYGIEKIELPVFHSCEPLNASNITYSGGQYELIDKDPYDTGDCYSYYKASASMYFHFKVASWSNTDEKSYGTFPTSVNLGAIQGHMRVQATGYGSPYDLSPKTIDIKLTESYVWYKYRERVQQYDDGATFWTRATRPANSNTIILDYVIGSNGSYWTGTNMRYRLTTDFQVDLDNAASQKFEALVLWHDNWYINEE